MDEASFRCEDCNAELFLGKWYGHPFEKDGFTTWSGPMVHAWLTVHEYHRLRFGRPSDDLHSNDPRGAFPDALEPVTYHSCREGTPEQQTPPAVDGDNARVNREYALDRTPHAEL